MAFGSDTLVVLVAVLATSAALWWWLKTTPIPTEPQPQSGGQDDSEPSVLLFDDMLLANATNTALLKFPLRPGEHFWDDMRDSLLGRYPDFPDGPGAERTGQMTLKPKDHADPQRIKIEWEDRLSWVTLIDTPITQFDAPLSAELDTLRRVTSSAAAPAWEENRDHRVIWHNDAYANLYQRVHGKPQNPEQPLFAKEDCCAAGRASLKMTKSDEVQWYEVTPVCTNQTTVFHATQITAVVKAEESQRNFVQTLAKTFAHLSSGLAIFNRDRQLVLFNPALVDLTGLPVQFLSARPDMLSFFDQLRERRSMPEPKNYRSWREEIADVIAAAADGRYEEIWSLESGQTYSVKGRPHPDGATAFLIEDISAEMSLARSFRAELEQAQVLLDTVDDSVAIFSPAGVLTFSNKAFQTLWRITPDTVFADITLHDCAKIWKTRAHRYMDTSQIDTFASDRGPSGTRRLRLYLDDSTIFECDLTPVSSCGVMVRFRQHKTGTQRGQLALRETAQ